MTCWLSPLHRALQNIALEQQMLAERSDNVLLFYVNAPAVVVGKHQVVAAEVDEAFCAAHGIDVVRRTSGGGAVYHDEGNINFAFVVNTAAAAPALDRNFVAPIVAALQALGVPAQQGCRNDIRCLGYKISGTAAHVAGGRQLFHGTLLHRANLHMLRLALNGNAALRGKGIASIPDRVANIAALMHSSESTEMFLHRLVEAVRTMRCEIAP